MPCLIKRTPCCLAISPSSCGSMITKRDLSYSKCRSISGSVPLPIEPKPIMTIGPLMRPCTGHWVIANLRERARRTGKTKVPHDYRSCGTEGSAPTLYAAGLCRLCDGNGLRGSRRRTAAAGVGANDAMRVIECASRELQAEEPIGPIRARHRQRRGLFGRKAEAAVVRRIADQQHGCVTCLFGGADRAPHQGGADAAAAAVGMHRERAEQQGRPVRAGEHRPEPDGADDAALLGGDEGEGRLAA